MYGVDVPRTAKEAYELDRENGNTLWKDAINKEINALLRLSVFEFDYSNKPTNKEENWQFAPLHLIFAVKTDLCRKARLVIGGHVTDASMYDCYASTVKTENIRLLMHQLVMSRYNLLAEDIGNTYVNAYTKEKIYSRAGIEFGYSNKTTNKEENWQFAPFHLIFAVKADLR